jgi:TPR repeat protein
MIRQLILMLACFSLGFPAFAEDDSKAPITTNKVAKWLAAAENGEPWACFNLGLSYHSGKDTEVNPAEAIRWYRAAAERNYAPAQANLGYCYDTGFGVAMDTGEAVRLYQAAALQGNAYAQYNLGKKYQAGPGVSLDPKAAEKWLKLAAQQNFVPAYFGLGQIYADEVGGKPDYREAFTWFRLAADRGYAAAQHAIGYLYFSGKGVQTNYFEAVKWYNQAASRNFADSHYNLAICYERGNGVPQNLTAAVNHFRTAAELGHRFAQYSLGVSYYEGKGQEVDLVQAYKWWNLAAVQGVPEAASSREILSRLLTESQIKEGQNLASKFEVRASTPAESPRLIQVASPDATEIKRVGAGVLISADGYLVTTSRVISGGKNVQVVTEGGTFNANVTKVDSLNDFALLKISGMFQPLPILASRDVPAGTEIVVLGFDGDNQGQFNPKVARGKITSLLGHSADPRQFSIEPRVTSGFGGSAIVNNNGQVVGVMLTDPAEASSGEAKPSAHSSTNGIHSFAIKSDHLLGFLRSVPDVKITNAHAPAKNGKEAPADDPLSKARAATALILVL